MKAWPRRSSTGPSLISPIRIFGPGRSPKMATEAPAARAAARTLAIAARWVAGSPCEKFTRATFIPAAMSCSSTSCDSEAGPMVQTILVFFSGRCCIICAILLVDPLLLAYRQGLELPDRLGVLLDSAIRREKH